MHQAPTAPASGGEKRWTPLQVQADLWRRQEAAATEEAALEDPSTPRHRGGGAGGLGRGFTVVNTNDKTTPLPSLSPRCCK